MRELIGNMTVILVILISFAAIVAPLVLWRCKDLLVEIRNELRAQRQGSPSSRP